MNVNDIAVEIFADLGSPVDTDTTIIATWLTCNIGQLNGYLALNAVVADDGTITLDNFHGTPILDCNQNPVTINQTGKVIFKLLYAMYYYGRQITNNLGAAAWDWVNVDEGDTHIRKTSRNDVAKVYQAFRAASQSQLDDLIFYYRQNKSLPESLCAFTDLQRFFRLEGTGPSRYY